MPEIQDVYDHKDECKKQYEEQSAHISKPYCNKNNIIDTKDPYKFNPIIYYQIAFIENYKQK
jgi:hypothetical protein